MAYICSQTTAWGRKSGGYKVLVVGTPVSNVYDAVMGGQRISRGLNRSSTSAQLDLHKMLVTASLYLCLPSSFACNLTVRLCRLSNPRTSSVSGDRRASTRYNLSARPT